MTLFIGHDRPGDQLARANWLPAPAGPFSLTMWFYGPGASVLDGSYRLPAPVRHR